MTNKLWQKAVLPITAGLILLESASAYAARCEYVIQSDWNSGFVAAIRITNDTSTAINGWSVNWSYSDGSRRTGGWNANFSGNNPYTATNVGWNSTINPGQTAEFGIQGNKAVQNAPATKPVITGAVCGGSTSSVSSVRSSSSSVSSSSLAQSSAVSLPRSSSSNTSSSARSNAGPSSATRSLSSSNSSTIGVSSSRASLPTSAARSSSSFALSSSSSSRSFSSDVSSRASSSFGVSSSFRSSSSFSSTRPNNLPVADLNVTVHGLTVHVDTRGSSDSDGDRLYHTISFGDDKAIQYDDAWHTYSEPGTYNIAVTVSDEAPGGAGTTKTQPVTVQVGTGNQAPIARLSVQREYEHILAYGSSSFDEEGTPLTYQWDFGEGSYIGDARAVKETCDTPLVTLTVSDGDLKDTIQGSFSGYCSMRYDLLPSAKFNLTWSRTTVFVDGSESSRETGFNWDFGDGTKAVGLKASHTYTASGTYNVTLTTEGMGSITQSATQSVVISSQSSSSSSVASSSSVRSSSSVVSSSSSSRVSSSAISSSSSSIRSSSSQASSDRNSYIAPRATTAPVIDGVVDSVWDRASWAPINVFWLGTQSNPSAQDYSGRYKALWDENYLYILYDITDDRIYDGVRDALDRYWEDDTVELFIDENKNGGQHGYNTSAWAYHISTYGDVVDSTTGGATLLNDHIDSRLVSNGTQHYWEMRIRIYGEDYADWKSNTPLQLYAGKLMGFSACYIDNDGSSQRESMMGSVDTQGHRNNQGYLDASVFGSMLLVE